MNTDVNKTVFELEKLVSFLNEMIEGVKQLDRERPMVFTYHDELEGMKVGNCPRCNELITDRHVYCYQCGQRVYGA